MSYFFCVILLLPERRGDKTDELSGELYIFISIKTLVYVGPTSGYLMESGILSLILKEPRIRQYLNTETINMVPEDV